MAVANGIRSAFPEGAGAEMDGDRAQSIRKKKKASAAIAASVRRVRRAPAERCIRASPGSQADLMFQEAGGGFRIHADCFEDVEDAAAMAIEQDAGHDGSQASALPLGCDNPIV